MQQILQTVVNGKKYNIRAAYVIGRNPFAPNYKYGGLVTDVQTGEEVRVDVESDGYTCGCDTQMIVDEACDHALALFQVHPQIREGHARPIILSRKF